MPKKYRVLILVVVVLTLTLVWTVLTHESKIPTTTTTETSQVWVNDCDTPVQRPQSLTLTCADGGMRLEELMWAVWDKNGAVGYGNYLENDCQPSCAEGTFSKTPVYVTVSKLIEFQGKSFLKEVEIKSDLGRQLPRGQTIIQWELMDF